MAGPLVVGAEGVLLIPDSGNYGASRPLTSGIELVMQLHHFPTSRTTVVVGVTETDMAEHWVKIHGLGQCAVRAIAPEDKQEEPDLAQWYAIRRLRAAGPLNMVLTAYWTVYEECKATHQPVLLFGRRGSLGAVEEPAPWSQLHEQVLRHRYAEVENIEDDDEDTL